MLRSVLGKTLGFVGYAVQYGCVAHCAFEYIGEVVVVGITPSLLIFYNVNLTTMKQFNFFLLFQCSGPSMEPTIVNQDVVFSERMSRHLYTIQKWVPASGFRMGARVEISLNNSHLSCSPEIRQN